MCGTKSCAILGHNPMRFAWGFDEEAAECRDMKMELAQQIMVLRQQGVTHFSVACDYGVGLYAAELINVLRDNDPELMLFCVTPYEEQATKWTPELRERYFDMLVKCSHMTAVYTHKQPDAQLKAYRTIIRPSDMVLAVYDPASARGDDTDKAISYAFVVDQAHTGLVDLFVNQVRKELAVPQEERKPSVMEKLKAAPAKNSPKISANSKGQER